jgi:uncharacterized FAD-dependent dehydrogenase
MNKNVVMVGAGVANINAATKLIDSGFDGKITIIDMGKDPYNRLPEEVMCGFAGAGLFSDGKWVYLHNAIGGHLSKYVGDDRASELIDETWNTLLRFHPDPSKVMFSNPIKEPKFIKPYFKLRMAPTYHIGTNYLHDLGKNWYDFLIKGGVEFIWESKVTDIDFDIEEVKYEDPHINELVKSITYDTLIFGTGKSGVDLTQKLIDKYNLKKEPKSVQVGVRMELPQKYTQKILDISYDFKLYQKPNNQVSLRTFCTNSGGAYVAEENTYGMKSYNGHSFKQEDMINNMNNFGIIMELKGIDNPFEYQKQLVKSCQSGEKGLFYSPNKKRKPSTSSEGKKLNVYQLDNLDSFKQAYGKYSIYIIDFIADLNKIFKFEDDYGLYIPEVKFLSEEVLVNYDDLSLIDYPNIHFVGDSLSSRGIAVSSCQGAYCVNGLI